MVTEPATSPASPANRRADGLGHRLVGVVTDDDRIGCGVELALGRDDLLEVPVARVDPPRDRERGRARRPLARRGLDAQIALDHTGQAEVETLRPGIGLVLDPFDDAGRVRHSDGRGEPPIFQPLGLGTLTHIPSRSPSRLKPPTTDCQVPVPSQSPGEVPAKSVEIARRAFKGLRFASLVINSPRGTRRRLTQGSGCFGVVTDQEPVQWGRGVYER